MNKNFLPQSSPALNVYESKKSWKLTHLVTSKSHRNFDCSGEAPGVEIAAGHRGFPTGFTYLPAG